MSFYGKFDNLFWNLSNDLGLDEYYELTCKCDTFVNFATNYLNAVFREGVTKSWTLPWAHEYIMRQMSMGFYCVDVVIPRFI